MPKFDFVSNTRPSLFAYPPATKPPTKEVVEKVATAVLSTTVKATARAKKAKEAENADGMDTVSPSLTILFSCNVLTRYEQDEKVEEKSEQKVEAKDEDMKIDEPEASSSTTTPAPAPTPKKIKKVEPTSDRLSNLSRVTPAQLSYISFPADSRYVPVRPFAAVTALSPTTTTMGSSLLSSANGNIHSTLASRAGGGGILMMRDKEPEKEAEFLEIEVTKVLEAPIIGGAVPVGAGGVAGGEVMDEGPIAEIPEPFEYNDWE